MSSTKLQAPRNLGPCWLCPPLIWCLPGMCPTQVLSSAGWWNTCIIIFSYTVYFTIDLFPGHFIHFWYFAILNNLLLYDSWKEKEGVGPTSLGPSTQPSPPGLHSSPLHPALGHHLFCGWASLESCGPSDHGPSEGCPSIHCPLAEGW